jgi:hypothetical protein
MSAQKDRALSAELRRLDELRSHQHLELPPLPELAKRALQEDVRRRGIIEPLEITSAGVVLDGREAAALFTELRRLGERVARSSVRRFVLDVTIAAGAACSHRSRPPRMQQSE